MFSDDALLTGQFRALLIREPEGDCHAAHKAGGLPWLLKSRSRRIVK